MSVAAEIGEHRLRPGKGSFCIDDPFDVAQGTEMSGEVPGIGKVAETAEEAQTAGIVRRRELFQEQAAEQPREHAHRQEEAGAAGYPAVAVKGDTATRHDTMHMGIGTDPPSTCAHGRAWRRHLTRW